MMELDFCTTATIRPELIDRTYESFSRSLKGVDFKRSTLYLNIDPIPAGDPMSCVEVAKKYFGTVVHRAPDYPNFTEALRWCWLSVKTPYFFQLEDDWVCTREISVQQVMEEFNKKLRTYLCAVTLRAYSNVAPAAICLSPSIYKTQYAKTMAAKLDGRFNPERQFREKTKANPAGGKNKPFFGMHWPRKRSEILVKDIGREWLSQRPDYYRGAGPSFITWIKK